MSKPYYHPRLRLCVEKGEHTYNFTCNCGYGVVPAEAVQQAIVSEKLDEIREMFGENETILLIGAWLGTTKQFAPPDPIPVTGNPDDYRRLDKSLTDDERKNYLDFLNGNGEGIND